MRQIKLDEGFDGHGIIPLPTGGWIVNIIENGKYHCPMIVYPEKENFVYKKKGHICNASYMMKEDGFPLSAICFCQNDKNGKEIKRHPVGKDGKIASSFDEAIQPPSYPNEHPDYYGQCFYKKSIDSSNLRVRMVHAAAGVLEGGIILLRLKDNQTITMSFPCEPNKVKFSSDGLTVIFGYKNLLTIIDNPLV